MLPHSTILAPTSIPQAEELNLNTQHPAPWCSVWLKNAAPTRTEQRAKARSYHLYYPNSFPSGYPLSDHTKDPPPSWGLDGRPTKVHKTWFWLSQTSRVNQERHLAQMWTNGPYFHLPKSVRTETPLHILSAHTPNIKSTLLMSQYFSEANLSVSRKSEYLLCRCLIMANCVPTVDLHDRRK